MVRKAEEGDLPRIAEIIIFGKRTAYRPIFQNDAVSFNDLTVVGLYHELYKNPAIWKNMFVYDDGIVKGVIGWSVTDILDTIELTNFYIEPVFKGQGIGRKIITHFIDERKGNCKKIMLWVLKDNLRARKFYEANGFNATGKEKIMEGTNKIDLQYIKMFE